MSDLPGDDSRRAAILAVSWLFCIISTAVVGARAYVRTVLDRRIWWDDVAIFLSSACVIAYTILVTIFANSGYARHAFYLSFTDMQGAISLNLAIQSLIIIPLGAGKVSGAFIQKRLMPLDAKCQQWVLTFVITSVSFITLMYFITLLASCQPISANWTPDSSGSCWNSTSLRDWTWFAFVYFAFADFFISFFILPLLPKLPFSTGKKVGIVVSIAVGFAAAGCSIAKTVHMPQLTGPDFTWAMAENLILNSAEVNLIIIAASLPALLPVGQQLKQAMQSPEQAPEQTLTPFESDKIVQYECHTSAPPLPLEMPCVLETVRAELPLNENKSTGTLDDDDGPAIHQSVDVHVQYEEAERPATRTKSIF